MVNVAVLGGGNGAHAAVADLTLKGFRVSLFSRWPEELRAIDERGGIDLIDQEGEHFVPFNRICGSIREVMEDAEVILITIPAIAHEYYAYACLPHLKKGMIIILNPGSTGGALAFKKILKENGMDMDVCETNTLTYICRLIGPSRVKVTSRSRVQFASIPGKKTEKYFDLFRAIFPEGLKSNNVIETSLTNINAILHPPSMILNAGWIEFTKGDFFYYYEGTTPSVARVIEEVDLERIAICEKVGYQSERFLEFFYKTGSTTMRAYISGSIYQALRESEPNKFIRAPESLSHRFLTEDVPYGLVPMAYLGRMLEVSTPTMDALINMASIINGENYWEKGRTLRKMGIEGMGLKDLLDYLENG